MVLTRGLQISVIQRTHHPAQLHSHSEGGTRRGWRREAQIGIHSSNRTQTQGIPGQHPSTSALRTNGLPCRGSWEDGRPSTCPPAPWWLPFMTIPLFILEKRCLSWPISFNGSSLIALKQMIVLRAASSEGLSLGNKTEWWEGSVVLTSPAVRWDLGKEGAGT